MRCLVILALAALASGLMAAVDLSGTWAFDIDRMVAHRQASEEYRQADAQTRGQIDQRLAALQQARGATIWTFGTEAVTMTTGGSSASLKITGREEAEEGVTLTIVQNGSEGSLVVTPVVEGVIRVVMNGKSTLFFRRQG